MDSFILTSIPKLSRCYSPPCDLSRLFLIDTVAPDVSASAPLPAMTEAQPSLGDDGINNDVSNGAPESSADNSKDDIAPISPEASLPKDTPDVTKHPNDERDGDDHNASTEEEEEDEEDDASEDDDDDEDEEDEEDDEPKLKYARLTQHMSAVYRNGDATSAFLVAGDKMIVGTHNGNIVSSYHDFRTPIKQAMLNSTGSMSSNYQISNPYAFTMPTPPPSPAYRYPRTRLLLSPRLSSPKLSSERHRNLSTDHLRGTRHPPQPASGRRKNHPRFPIFLRIISTSELPLWMETSASSP